MFILVMNLDLIQRISINLLSWPFVTLSTQASFLSFSQFQLKLIDLIEISMEQFLYFEVILVMILRSRESLHEEVHRK